MLVKIFDSINNNFYFAYQQILFGSEYGTWNDLIMEVLLLSHLFVVLLLKLCFHVDKF